LQNQLVIARGGSKNKFNKVELNWGATLFDIKINPAFLLALKGGKYETVQDFYA
jgi:hypothetical protein